MQLVVLGLSHKTAPVEIRECFSLAEDRVYHGLRHLKECEGVYECAILSTCNRTEVYAVVDDASDGLALKEYLVNLSGGKFPIEEYLYLYKEGECIRHLMRVAASLDSLVVGENQILSQVKKAYAIARTTGTNGTTGTILNTLFNRAIAAGKRVRTRTRIGYNAVSVSYAAVELAKKAFGDLSHSKVLLLGAGKMSELTARHLKGNGVQTTFVSNRNFSRAVELAEDFGGMAVPLEDFMQYAADADIVIASTGAPHYLVSARDVPRLMAERQGRPIIFVDIAVPRDVEPEVGAIAGVSLYNIDALEAVVASNLMERAQEAQAAEAIIEEAAAETLARFRHRAFRPVLSGLTAKAEHTVTSRIIVGTRNSKLALWQANLVAGRIRERHPHLEVVLKHVSTTGDRLKDVPLTKMSVEGVFTGELEKELLSGEIDLAVHSLKDLPNELPPGLALGAIMERADARDALISPTYRTLDNLPHGARVGVSSLRRKAQLLALRPDLAITDLRGNIDDRVTKLDSENLDAIVLAVAGLQRLGMEEHITEIFPMDVFLPAAGQGAMAIEMRRDDRTLLNALSFLHHEETAWAVTAERAFTHVVEEGGPAPAGAWARVEAGTLLLDAVILSRDGRAQLSDSINGATELAERLAETLARRMLAAGGRDILAGAECVNEIQKAVHE